IINRKSANREVAERVAKPAPSLHWHIVLLCSTVRSLLSGRTVAALRRTWRRARSKMLTSRQRSRLTRREECVNTLRGPARGSKFWCARKTQPWRATCSLHQPKATKSLTRDFQPDPDSRARVTNTASVFTVSWKRAVSLLHAPFLRGKSIWKNQKARGSILPMFKLLFATLAFSLAVYSADLPSKKYLNLAAIKTMVGAAEAEAQKRHVEVTICIVDESGNLLFLQKADAASLNTIVWAQKKARHAAFYRSPSKDAADNVKKGNVEALAFPDY